MCQNPAHCPIYAFPGSSIVSEGSLLELGVPPIQLEHGWSPNNFMIKFLVDRAYERSQPQGTSQAEVPGAAEALTGRLLKSDV